MYAKIVHKQLNTMQINAKWGIGSSICPLCFKAPEDWTHLYVCTCPDMQRVRDEFASEIEISLKKHNTYPPLRDFILEMLDFPSFHFPEALVVVNPLYTLVADSAFQSQTNMGWSNFYRGIVSQQWKKIQTGFFWRRTTETSTLLTNWRETSFIVCWNIYVSCGKRDVR